jgi:hypothetical protein
MTLRLMRLQGKQVIKTMDISLEPSLFRTGDVWHVEVNHLKDLDTLSYCWMASGEVGWRGRARYSPGACLLDPYSRGAAYVKQQEAEQGGKEILATLILPESPPIDRKGAVRPRRALEEMVMLEIDPFTFALAGRVVPGHEGKWLGVLDRLEDIQALGANTVLLPCPMFREEGLGVQVCPARCLNRHAPCHAFAG